MRAKSHLLPFCPTTLNEMRLMKQDITLKGYNAKLGQLHIVHQLLIKDVTMPIVLLQW